VPEGREGLPRLARIRRANEIRALLERGKRKRTKNVDVFLSPSPVSFCRLGIVVPKHGRRIVDRNRLKRRLREIGRRDVLPELQAGGFQVDVLVRARSQAYGAGFEVLNREVREAVEGLCSDAS
jgi:ribonuclease P protein component